LKPNSFNIFDSTLPPGIEQRFTIKSGTLSTKIFHLLIELSNYVCMRCTIPKEEITLTQE